MAVPDRRLPAAAPAPAAGAHTGTAAHRRRPTAGPGATARRTTGPRPLPPPPISYDRVDRDPFTAALDALNVLADWIPPPATFRRIFDYPDRVARYRARGLLDDEDRDALIALLGRCGQWSLNHGGPLPSNLIYHDGTCGLVDWEFTGLYLPGFDLALLRTVLARTPRAAARIEQTVVARGIEVRTPSTSP